MKPDELEKIINEAFENKQSVSESSDKKILDAIKETIELTDKGIFEDCSQIIKTALQRCYDYNSDKKGITSTALEIALKKLLKKNIL